jgi:hypothetical protein
VDGGFELRVEVGGGAAMMLIRRREERVGEGCKRERKVSERKEIDENDDRTSNDEGKGIDTHTESPVSSGDQHRPPLQAMSLRQSVGSEARVDDSQLEGGEDVEEGGHGGLLPVERGLQKSVSEGGGRGKEDERCGAADKEDEEDDHNDNDDGVRLFEGGMELLRVLCEREREGRTATTAENCFESLRSPRWPSNCLPLQQRSRGDGRARKDSLGGGAE